MTQLISALGFWNTTATRHTPVEDVQGIFSGALISALGLYVLASAGLLTGSTAGIAFLLHYAFGINFGLAFFFLNFTMTFSRIVTGSASGMPASTCAQNGLIFAPT